MNTKQKKALYESIMKSISSNLKASLNENNEIEDNADNEYVLRSGSIRVDMEIGVNPDGSCYIYMADDEGGSGVEATGETPEAAANDAVGYLIDYFYEYNEE